MVPLWSIVSVTPPVMPGRNGLRFPLARGGQSDMEDVTVFSCGAWRVADNRHGVREYAVLLLESNSACNCSARQGAASGAFNIYAIER
jgi:hypothetical protein